ncbi:hypothetical protein HanIR_Chr04g0190921 [Helianthus annuus]|nr:hypothetical protein HanIR_Chr04g0190921 [Helianthus annuus]
MPPLMFTLTHLCYTHDSKFIRFTFIHTLTIIHLRCPYTHVYTTFVFIFIRVMFSFALLQLCYTYTHTHVFYSYLNIHVLHVIFTFTSILMHPVFILIFILVFTLVLAFILSFIRFMLYSYSCLYFHLYDLCYTRTRNYTPVYTIYVIFVLAFIPTFIIFLLYSYFCLYSHLYELCLYSRHSLCSNCAHIYAHFLIHVTLILLLILLACVLCLCSRACSNLNLYYTHAFYSKKIYTFAHVHGRNPKDSLTLDLYYLERKHAYMLHFYTHAFLFSKFMYTLSHT